MVNLAGFNPKLVFLTGDLGFMAMEPLQAALGDRFINAGIAEQNMVSVAAGLASTGWEPWIYSIAPFITLRPYEQLRNDVCLHRLPVRVVGNGGGFGYGIMGSTHHALEDIGSMRLLPGMTSFVPTYGTDVEQAVTLINQETGPSYLRLNLALNQKAPQPFSGWRCLAEGSQAVVVTTGPVVKGLLDCLEKFPQNTFQIYSVGKFPSPLPDDVIAAIEKTGILMTLEEHLGPAGLGECLSGQLLGKLSGPIHYSSLSAIGYPSGRYGSQTWHLEECGLAGEPLLANLHKLLAAPRPTKSSVKPL